MIASPDRILSKNNPRVKALCLLKLSPSADAFLIEGKHLCEMAYEAGCLREVYSLEPCEYGNVPLTLVGEEVLRKIAFAPSPSGVVGVASYRSPALESRKVLVLDKVQDPGNVGTLLRTALAFGYKEVWCTKGTASPFHHKVIASSQGAIFSLRILTDLEPLEVASEASRRGYLLLSSALRNAIPLKETEIPTGKFALVLGNEGQGVDEKLLEVSSRVIKIEMEGIESLNVGVAGGILMYRL